jgi:hypothetical protein
LENKEPDMNTNGTGYEFARCQEINQYARQAEVHQQEFYRDDLLHPVKKAPAWNACLKFYSGMMSSLSRHAAAQKAVRA